VRRLHFQLEAAVFEKLLLKSVRSRFALIVTCSAMVGTLGA
jgi:hypothetical protein